MATHRMHLKGPWQYAPLRQDAMSSAATDALSPGRVIMPCTWQRAFGDFRGVVRFLRSFHRPTNLDPDERVFLVCCAVGGEGELQLDDRPVGRLASRETPQEFDITDRLRPDMRLSIDLEFVSPGDTFPGGLWGPVLLEIRRAT